MSNMRANRVAIRTNGDNFVASFYRTHKALTDIYSENTEWEAPSEMTNKTMARESFRQWIIDNAYMYGIDWKPQDMRTEDNIRRAKYTNDEELVSDATGMLMDEMRKLADKCKYPVAWGGISFEDIVPMTHTGMGRDLTTMGIENGKYKKSGNWAWATIVFTVTLKYNKDEVYVPVNMQLVSGQLKKTGMGITEFNSKVKDEIIGAGLATAEELDPPKEKSSKKADAKPVDTEDTEMPLEPAKEELKQKDTEVPVAVAEQVQESEEAPKKRRRRRSSKKADAE